MSNFFYTVRAVHDSYEEAWRVLVDEGFVSAWGADPLRYFSHPSKKTAKILGLTKDRKVVVEYSIPELFSDSGRVNSMELAR